MTALLSKFSRPLLLSLILAGNSFSDENAETNAIESITDETVAESKETAFDYEFIDVAENLVIIKSSAPGDETETCGFIMMMDDKPYLLTSQHFMLGTGRLNFTSLSGRTIKPRSIEISAGSDLIRLALSEGEGLQLNNSFTMNDPVAVFGTTDLNHGTNTLYGEINGVGADIFEVSAGFEKDHSGSPVLNANGEVLGMASYAVESNTHIMKIGTRFENSKRRFCLRLNQTDWKPVNWKKYNDKFGSAYRINRTFIDDIICVLNSWSEGPLDQVNFDSRSGRMLTNWIDSHNTVVSRSVGTGSDRRNFYSDYSQSTEKLSSLCRTHSRELYMLSEQRGLTDFMINELEMQASTLEYAAKIIDRYGSSTYRTDD